MELILEQRWRRQFGCQEQERRLLHLPLILSRLLGLKLPKPVQISGEDLLGVNLHGTKKVLVDNRRGTFLGSSQRQVERVEEPWQELT